MKDSSRAFAPANGRLKAGAEKAAEKAPAPDPAVRGRQLVARLLAAQEASREIYRRYRKSSVAFAVAHTKAQCLAHARRWEKVTGRVYGRQRKLETALSRFVLKFSGWQPPAEDRVDPSEYPSPALIIGDSLWLIVLDDFHNDGVHRLVSVPLGTTRTLPDPGLVDEAPAFSMPPGGD